MARPAADLLPASWQPRDLSDVLSGNYEPTLPTLCRRDDGANLFYPGRTHSVASVPEGGKTWLALLATLQELQQGNPVVYIDYEDSPEGIGGRLRLLDLEERTVGNLFTYVRPGEPLGDPQGLLTFIGAVCPSLVIIDGVTGAMSTEGLNVNDNQDVAELFNRMPTPLAHLGPAVVLLDHEVKRENDRNRYALGAQHKLAAISGVSVRLARDTPFAVGRTGLSRILINKDRMGEVARRTLDGSRRELFGYLRVASAGSDQVEVELVKDAGVTRTLDRLTSMKTKMVEAMGDSQYSGKTEVKNLVTGAAATKTQALNELIESGHVSEKPLRVRKRYPE